MKIDLTELEHLPEKSVYNNNYYRHKKSNADTTLFVHTNEEYNTENIYVVSGDKKIFLGSCQFCDDGNMEINLGEMYT